MKTKFRIDTLWPSGTISEGTKTGNGLQISEVGCWWLLDGNAYVLGFTPETGTPEHGGRKTIIRLV